MLKTLFIVLLIALVVVAISYYLKMKNKSEGGSKIHKNMQEKNEMNKDRIMKLFENKERVISQDVQSTLLIEESETEEYLEELTKEMKIRRMGEGDMVYYTKVEAEKKK